MYSLINHNYGVGFLPDVIARNYNPKTNHVEFFHFQSRSNHRTIGLAFREDFPHQDLVPKLIQAIKKGTVA